MATAQQPEIDWDAFRLYVAERRRKLKITQADFAALIGRKQPDISAIEKGKITPNTVDTFLRIADALQVAPATLIKKFRFSRE